MHLEFNVGVFTAAIVFATNAASEPLHIEPGLWDVTYSYSVQGSPPPSVLASLPPEKRAAMQAAWAARAGQTKTSNSQTCVTAEELAKGTAFESGQDADSEGCERTMNTQTATRWTLTERCETDQGPAERHVQINANGPRAVSGTMNAMKGEAGTASGVDMTFAGKWVAKDCAGVD